VPGIKEICTSSEIFNISFSHMDLTVNYHVNAFLKSKLKDFPL
jgi:hypothetical protein